MSLLTKWGTWTEFVGHGKFHCIVLQQETKLLLSLFNEDIYKIVILAYYSTAGRCIPCLGQNTLRHVRRCNFLSLLQQDTENVFCCFAWAPTGSKTRRGDISIFPIFFSWTFSPTGHCWTLIKYLGQAHRSNLWSAHMSANMPFQFCQIRLTHHW